MYVMPVTHFAFGLLALNWRWRWFSRPWGRVPGPFICHLHFWAIPRTPAFSI